MAALGALGTAPGRLYPVAYLGPLDGSTAVRRAFRATPHLRHLRVVEAAEGVDLPNADVVICRLQDARAVRAAVRGRPAVQLLVVGELAPERIGVVEREELGQGAVLVDVRPELSAAQSGRVAEGVEQVVRGAGKEPLVLLAAEEAVQEAVEECEMYFACEGLRVRLLAGERDLSPPPVPGEAWLVPMRYEGGLTPAGAAAAAAACGAVGVPLIIVAVPGAWDGVREDSTWRSAVSRCSVLRGGAVQVSEDLVSWPPVSDLWIGGVRPAPDVDPAMRIPPGTPLVAALAHLEISNRPGSLVVWGCDRVAVVRADQRAPGAVVVEVRVGGAEPPRTRDEALRALDAIRGWENVELAVVAHPHRGAGCLAETVTRVGFFLSRTDDERSAGVAGHPSTMPACAPGEIARTLVQHGLLDAAVEVLRDCPPSAERPVEDSLLLAFLLAERAPAEAVSNLRDAAFRAAAEHTRGSEAQQVEATLNALLLLVRGRQIAPEDAWATLEPWIDAGGNAWVSTPQHAAIAFELATRSGHPVEARDLATAFDQLAHNAHPLRLLLGAHLRTALDARRAA